MGYRIASTDSKQIAAAGHRESNMWQHHSNQLLRIITLRRQFQGVEPYDFIVSFSLCVPVVSFQVETFDEQSK
jgi:hypothetical protein